MAYTTGWAGWSRHLVPGRTGRANFRGSVGERQRLWHVVLLLSPNAWVMSWYFFLFQLSHPNQDRSELDETFRSKFYHSEGIRCVQCIGKIHTMEKNFMPRR